MERGNIRDALINTHYMHCEILNKFVFKIFFKEEGKGARNRDRDRL